MTVRGTSVVRAVLAGAVVCAIALAVTAPALAGPATGPTPRPGDRPCVDAGLLDSLLDDPACAPDADEWPLLSPLPPDPPPVLGPGSLLDRDFPDFPELPDGSDDDSDDDSEPDSDSDDDSDSDGETDSDTGSEETDDTSTGDAGSDDTGSDDTGTDGTDEADEADEAAAAGDANTGDGDPEATQAAGDDADAVATAATAERASEAVPDAGAGAAVGRAVLPGVGDAVDGGSAGLDWTGALGAGAPPEPAGPLAPPVDQPTEVQSARVDPLAATEPAAAAAPSGSPVPDEHVAAAAFVGALPSPAEVGWGVRAVLTSLALTLLLLAVLALPVGLVNRAAAERADRVHGLLARLRVPPAAVPNAAGTLVAAVAVTAVAGAVMTGFLVPAFPFDASAPAVLVGLVVAFVVVTAAMQGSQLLYVGRWWGVRCRLTPFPGFLLLAAVGVVLSRAVGLEPGLLLGTLVAFGTARPLRADEAGPAVALAATALTAVGALAWVLRDPLVAAAGADGSFLPAALGTALTATTAAAVANLVFALVPVSFLPGAALLRWSPLLWALFACVGGFAFVHVLARPTADALAGRAGLLAVLLTVYLVGAAVLWTWLRTGFVWSAAARLNPATRR